MQNPKHTIDTKRQRKYSDIDRARNRDGGRGGNRNREWYRQKWASDKERARVYVYVSDSVSGSVYVTVSLWHCRCDGIYIWVCHFVGIPLEVQ